MVKAVALPDAIKGNQQQPPAVKRRWTLPRYGGPRPCQLPHP